MQKYLDFLFYVALCAVGVLGFAIYSNKTDKRFMVTPTPLQKDSVYESYELDLSKDGLSPQSISAAKLEDHSYMVSFLSNQQTDSKVERNIFAVLFLPGKYSMPKSQGGWESITSNTKIWTPPKRLATQTSIGQQTRRYIGSISSPFFFRHGDKLLLFLNTQGFSSRLTNKIAMLSTPIENLDAVFGNEGGEFFADSKAAPKDHVDIREQKPLPLSLEGHLSFAAFGDFNYFLSSGAVGLLSGSLPLGLDSKRGELGLILPLTFRLRRSSALFGVLDSKLALQEVSSVEGEVALEQPSLTPMPVADNGSGVIQPYACLAAYRSYAKTREKSLYFQTCQLENGTLQLDSLKKSQNLKQLDSLQLSTLGSTVLLLYTKRQSRQLELAIWDGADFMPIKEIANLQEGAIVSKTIATNGEYGYIFYADSRGRLHAVIINEAYVSALASENQSKEVR